MTDTCQQLPTRGCMAAHQFAAESPCAQHPPLWGRAWVGFGVPVPRCLTAEEWPRWGFMAISEARWIELNERHG